MKALKYLCLLLPCLAGCSENGLDLFTNTQNSVYFAVDGTTTKYTETTTFSFSEITNNVDTVNLKIALLGLPDNENRYVDFEVIADSTDAIRGEHYDFISERILVEPTDNEVLLKVIVLRDQSLQDDDFTVRIALKNNEWFSVAPKEELINTTTGEKVVLSSHKIVITGKIPMPHQGKWSMLGFQEYTIKKHMLINEINNITATDWDTAMYSVMQIWAVKTRNYLQRMYNEGTPVYEDAVDAQGNPVLMRVDGVTF